MNPNIQHAVRKLRRLLGALASVATTGADKKEATDVLMQVYARRPDLQEVFPEARSGDLRRFGDWAAGASSGQWKDDAYSTLAPYSGWYNLNWSGRSAAVALPVPWDTMRNTARHSRNQLHAALAAMEHPTANDIGDHLITMSLLVTEFGLQQIVELGTRSGNSTLALLAAAQATGGRVLSVDLEPCTEAQQRVANSGFASLWRFVEAHDLELPAESIPQPIDFLFIDTSHLYAHTLAELQRYSEFVRPGGWIALHDYVSFPGVRRAVQEFVHSRSPQLAFFPLVHTNGLALLRLAR